MQTKRKRKQWALLAFTMIATFVLQIATPLTANAEEQRYSVDNFLYYDYTKKSYNGETYDDYKYAYSFSANKPFKLASIEDVKKPFESENTIIGQYGIIFLFEDITDIQAKREVDLIEDDCKSCSHTSISYEYTEEDFKKYYDNDGNFLCYGLTFWSSYEKYDTETSTHWEVLDYLTILNDSCFSYMTTREQLGFSDDSSPVLSGEAYAECVKAIYNGTLRPNGQFNESTAIYDTNIPTPKITVKNDYSFGFNNDSDGYYFQVKGRWYSVDDIELYKEKLQWCYKYESIIKSNLTDWVTTNEKASTSMQDLNFATFGKTAFDSFLSYYPIENRSYSGGTNSLGNFFNGYNDALSQIKMLLSQPTTFYNGIEIYIRYYTFDENGVAHYGKWCHYYDDLANQDGSNGVIDDYIHNDDKDLHNGYQSEFGVDDDKLLELESSNNSKNDIDLKPEEDNRYTDQIVSVDDLDLSNLINSLGGLKEQGSELINMFTTVFSFLPSWLVTLIVCSFGLCCVIGVWKVIRG